MVQARNYIETGDQGKKLSDGNFLFLGRKSRTYKNPW